MVLGVVVATAFGIEREAQRLLDQASPNTPQVNEARAVLNPAAGPTTTFLILGSSARPAEAPWEGTSDTMILVRLDAQRQLISMMSIPRDLQVTIPGYGVQKIDAALSLGGPQLAIRVVQQEFGVPINHYLVIFWQGFFEVVQQIGGIYTEVDRRYYNPVGDSWTPIDLHPGYQLLNGNQALEYVRFRHLDTDIVRESRQQKVLLDMRQQAIHSLGVTDIPGLLSAVAGSVQTDVHSVSTVLDLARFILGLPKGRIARSTVDVTLGPSYVYADQAQINASMQRYLNPVVATPGTATLAAALRHDRVHVTVENAGAGPAAALQVTDALRGHGFDATSGGDAPTGSTASTLYYAPADEQAAQTLAADLSPVLVAPAPPGVLSGVPMVLVIGSGFPVSDPFHQNAPAPPPHPTTSVTYTSADVVPDPALTQAVASSLRRPGLRLLVPTRFAPNTSLAPVEGVRAYRILGRGGGSWPAVNLSFQLGAAGLGQYWDVMETTMTNPPLLEQATSTITKGTRRYQVLNDGTGVRDVAFRQNGVWYWINNTLLDALSAHQMVELAAGLVPTTAAARR